MRHALHISCLLLAGSLVLTACSESNGSSDSANKETHVTGFPRPLFDKLLAECDYVDIIFYNSPASVSQTDKNSIRSALMFMEPEPATINPNCKAIGRIAYMIQGEIIAEGDIYASGGCSYLAFIEDGNVVYANKLSQNGSSFFSGILQQIEQARQ